MVSVSPDPVSPISGNPETRYIEVLTGINTNGRSDVGRPSSEQRSTSSRLLADRFRGLGTSRSAANTRWKERSDVRYETGRWEWKASRVADLSQ